MVMSPGSDGIISLLVLSIIMMDIDNVLILLLY